MIAEQFYFPSPVVNHPEPTICGMSPQEVHDRFWATRGVQVVRAGVASEVVEGAELFLLTDSNLLTIFRLRLLVEELCWLKPAVLWVRVQDRREHGYREQAVQDHHGNFLGFQRFYSGADSRMARVALTPSYEAAQLWQSSPDARIGWQRLRQSIPRVYRATARVQGLSYNRQSPLEIMRFMRDVVARWQTPNTTISRLVKQTSGIWADRDATIGRNLRVAGPIWIGAGRHIPDGATAIGPAVLWDSPLARPPSESVRWSELEPSPNLTSSPKLRRHWILHKPLKRLTDVVLGAILLLFALPLFPLTMLAIYLEDGRPFFFGHKRETTGGREFKCWKFRSMRHDAEAIKQKLATHNQADGPQFFMEQDPRVTRVGWIIRKYYLDELPQLFNVLRGDMGIVGPRPSPRRENQFCPSWREARLSVRPGITGLWQVMRSRVPGRDFQEWIKYDIEYVEKESLWLDFWILWKTVLLFLRIR